MKTRALGDVAQIIPGTSPKGEFINSEGLGYPFFQGVKEFGIMYPTPERYTEKPVRLAQPGDILFSVRAPVGRTNLASVECAIGRGIMAIRPISEEDRNYILYFLRSLVEKWDSLGATGSVFESINVSALRELEIFWPPNRKQLSQVLWSLDEKIRINRQIASTLEQIAQTIFKSWFVDFDPVHAKARGEQPPGMDAETAALFPGSFEESELGPVPSGWTCSPLLQIATLVKQPIKAGNETLELPYVPIDMINSKNIYITQTTPSEMAKTSLLQFQKGDVLFGAMRPYFHKVALAPFDGVTRTTTFVLRPLSHRFFALFSLFQESTVAYATTHSQGSTIPYAVWDNGLGDLKTVKPSKPVLDHFEELTAPLITYAETLLAQNNALSELRDSLLPRLISGELEIPVELLGE